MKIFFDTEFMEDGTLIELLSIGMIREDGETLYLEYLDADLTHANDFVVQNVLPHMKGPKFSLETIRRIVTTFCGDAPEFWADYCSYDWIVLCQLFGTMMDLPLGWPTYCNDIQTYKLIEGIEKFPKLEIVEHHALEDAKEVKFRYEYMKGTSE
jgi:hypothetical protein